jgi:hypothetical protein
MAFSSTEVSQNQTGPAGTEKTSDDIIIGPAKTVDEFMQKVADSGVTEVIRVGPRNAGAEQRCAEAGITMRTVPTITAKQIREMGKGKRVLFHIARNNLMPAEAAEQNTASVPSEPASRPAPDWQAETATHRKHHDYENDGLNIHATGDDDWFVGTAREHVQVVSAILTSGATFVVEIGKGFGMESACAGYGIGYIRVPANQGNLEQFATGQKTLFYKQNQ